MKGHQGKLKKEENEGRWQREGKQEYHRNEKNWKIRKKTFSKIGLKKWES